jgi:Family of unknown function (DUF6263)
MTVRATGLAFAALALAAVSAAGADVTLRWKFHKGKPYHYVLTRGTEVNMMLLDNSIKTKTSEFSDITWVVSAVNPDGSADMTQTIDRVQIKVEGPTGAIDVDSKQKADLGAAGTAALMRKLVDAMVGSPTAVVMSARGEVTSYKLTDKLSKALKMAEPQAAPALGSLFGEKGMKQLMEQVLMLLPEKPVSPGATWQQNRAFDTGGSLGVLRTDTTYTDEGDAAGKPGLRLIEGAVKSELQQPEHGQVSVRVVSQHTTVKFFFDTTAGHLSRSEMKQNLKIEVSAGTQTMNTDLAQTVTLVLVGEPPAK